jgi:hypothetical protein
MDVECEVRTAGMYLLLGLPVTLGPLLDQVPLHLLKLVIGVLPTSLPGHVHESSASDWAVCSKKTGSSQRVEAICFSPSLFQDVPSRVSASIISASHLISTEKAES